MKPMGRFVSFMNKVPRLAAACALAGLLAAAAAQPSRAAQAAGGLPPAPPAEPIIKSVHVRSVKVTGCTVFTDAEVAAVTAPYENRNLTMEDLESLRRALTRLYVERGYVNSGIVIPDQAVSGGVVVMQAVEGRLTRIEIDGNKAFGEGFLRDRIAVGDDAVLDVRTLQERLQLLQQDQRIQRVHAELRPGANQGEGELRVKVEEKPPLYAWLAFNNYQSPSVGAERALLTVAHQNLTGRGDVASLTYGDSDGLDLMLDASYSIPVTARDTTLQLRYRKNNFGVVDEVFAPLDIVSKSENYELALRHPFYRTLNSEFAAALSVEHETNRTFLMGEPYSFSPGVDNGRSVVVPLRFSQEWTYRTQRQALSLRSRFSWGLDVGNATMSPDKGAPDAAFFSWLGQVQWARILDTLDTQVLVRADMQRSNGPLLPVEQVAVGGRYSVRGYRENLLVRDQAFIASAEARVPVARDRWWAEYLQLCAFVDYGRATDKSSSASGPSDISSIGAGVRWSGFGVDAPVQLRPEFEVYWGHRLRDVDHPNDDLQDHGIHLQAAITGYF